MRSPVLAMLWEQWRLTRIEAANRLGLGLVAGSAALVLFDAGATTALVFLLWQFGMFWMSIAKLTGGTIMDGYKPGFPLHLLYTRPVRTPVFVGVAMAYDAVSCAALYLVCAALLGLAFDQPFPMLSVVMWIVAVHLFSTCAQWATRNRVLQYLGSFSVLVLFAAPLFYRTDWSTLQVQFSLAENALMASIGLASFGLTVAGVSRQRHGDPPVAMPWTAGLARVPRWRVGLPRFACPTSSSTRAQVWFELSSGTIGVLVIGGALAIAIPLSLAAGGAIDVLLSGFFGEVIAGRAIGVIVAIFSVPVVLILGGNAFGIRRKQGRIFVSPFDATLACGTARMAGLKVLVRSACVLAALVAVVTSVWTSASVIPFDVLGDQDTFIEKSQSSLSGRMRAIEAAVVAMNGYELLALAFVASILVAVMVASRAAHVALRARHRRGLNIAGWMLLLYGLVLVLLALAAGRGLGSPFLLQAMLAATKWIVAAAGVLATAYLFWSAVAERLLTPRAASVALLVSAAFGAAWVTVLPAAGVQLAGMAATDAVWMLSPVLLPPMASAVAPWSLSRIRHT